MALFAISTVKKRFECQNEVSAVLLSNFPDSSFFRVWATENKLGFFLFSSDTSHHLAAEDDDRTLEAEGREQKFAPIEEEGPFSLHRPLGRRQKRTRSEGNLAQSAEKREWKSCSSWPSHKAGQPFVRELITKFISLLSLSRPVDPSWGREREATCLERERWPGNWVKRRERDYTRSVVPYLAFAVIGSYKLKLSCLCLGWKITETLNIKKFFFQI